MVVTHGKPVAGLSLKTMMNSTHIKSNPATYMYLQCELTVRCHYGGKDYMYYGQNEWWQGGGNVVTVSEGTTLSSLHHKHLFHISHSHATNLPE